LELQWDSCILFDMQLQSRKDVVYLVLAAFFISNAVLAELIGVKLILLPVNIPGFGQPAASIGVIPWPVVLIATDIMNEYFGKEGVKRITLITAAMIAYCFVIIYFSMQVPAASFSPVNDSVFSQVFGQSLWIIVGSLTAFIISQIVDVAVFWFFRERTKGRMLWLRSTGSTVVSQLFDSIIVVGIAFWLPGKVSTSDFLNVAFTNYSYKLVIAIGMTPLIYVVHNMIDKFLGHEAEKMIEASAKKSLAH
jgi:queuosine precursor transporter